MVINTVNMAVNPSIGAGVGFYEPEEMPTHWSMEVAGLSVTETEGIWRRDQWNHHLGVTACLTIAPDPQLGTSSPGFPWKTSIKQPLHLLLLLVFAVRLSSEGSVRAGKLEEVRPTPHPICQWGRGGGKFLKAVCEIHKPRSTLLLYYYYFFKCIGRNLSSEPSVGFRQKKNKWPICFLIIKGHDSSRFWIFDLRLSSQMADASI